MMTSSESEYSLSDEQMEAAEDLSAEEQLEASQTLPGTSLDSDDHDDSVSLCQEPHDLPHVKYQPFPKDATQSFYTRGMRGWGKKHGPDIASAAGATGLQHGQIEVSIINTSRVAYTSH